MNLLFDTEILLLEIYQNTDTYTQSQMCENVHYFIVWWAQ